MARTEVLVDNTSQRTITRAGRVFPPLVRDKRVCVSEYQLDEIKACTNLEVRFPTPEPPPRDEEPEADENPPMEEEPEPGAEATAEDEVNMEMRVDLNALNYQQLRDMARDEGVEQYYLMNTEELREALSEVL